MSWVRLCIQIYENELSRPMVGIGNSGRGWSFEGTQECQDKCPPLSLSVLKLQTDRTPFPQLSEDCLSWLEDPGLLVRRQRCLVTFPSHW